jgi:predicted dehydrogenase
MSAAWLNAAKEASNLEMVGLVDINEANAKKRAAEFGLSRATTGTDLKTVLDQVSPDVVFDCTVPEAHSKVTITALKHGCHVLGEKPLASSMDEAREMVATAKETGKIYAVIQNRRYDPRMRRIQNFLKQAPLGKITTIHCDFYLGAHFGGFRDRMEHPLVLDMAIHTFDAARCMTGADPLSVYCKEWNPAGSWYDHDASAVAIFEMTGGIVYTYRGSWVAEGLNTPWESEWRIMGDEGALKWDGAEKFEAQVIAEKGGFVSKCHSIDVPPYHSHDRIGGHTGLVREFLQCVETGATPETICTDNIKSLAMVFGAIESAKQQKLVQVRW